MNNSKKKNDDFVYGIRPVEELFNSNTPIEKIFVLKGNRNDHIQKIGAQARKLEIPMVHVPMEKLNKITKKNHQGIICFISAVHYVSLDNIIASAYEKGKDPFIIVLDRVTDVRNFGAICRTAECAGVDGILVPERGGAMIGSDAMRTSAGALNYIPIARERFLKEKIAELKENGLKVVGCTEKTEQNLYETDLKGPLAIIMGSEENGISPEYLKLCDDRTKIPLKGSVGSLNVSVAMSIVTYEAVRQNSL